MIEKAENLLSQVNFENFKTQWISKMECVTHTKDELFLLTYQSRQFSICSVNVNLDTSSDFHVKGNLLNMLTYAHIS